jgi:predicted RNA-binding protein YlqC (UPF0109 family)
MPKNVDLKGLLEYIIKNLVDNPDQVVVNAAEKQGNLVFELKVSEQDRGRVIGKQGKTIKAIRKLISAAASGSERRVVLELVE